MNEICASDTYATISDLTTMNSMISDLKRVNRRLLSNLFLSEAELDGLIRCNKLYFSYDEGNYLNIWYKEHNFFRLYFFITDIQRYVIPEISDHIIIELFGTKENEQMNELISYLSKYGINEYSRYHRWVNREIPNQNTCKKDAIVHCGKPIGIYEGVLSHFDIYSDHIPESNAFETYLDDKKILYMSSDFGELMGALIVSRNGKTETLEYLFVNENFRGFGVAYSLYNALFESNENGEILQYVSWIRDNNLSSIKINSKMNFVKQNSYKIVLKKGN